MTIDPHHIVAFKADLAALTRSEMFTKYVESDACYGLPQIDQHTLRATIADNFALDPKDVIIVGSAKLGFTLTFKEAKSPTEEDRPPFSPFSDRSDVDVAIVSDRLFDDMWKRCFEFWHLSGYSKAASYWPRGKNFRDYIFRGWMRPDCLPTEASIPLRTEWFEFFREMTNARLAGDFPIKAGLYRERYFLERYQWQSLDKALEDWTVA